MTDDRRRRRLRSGARLCLSLLAALLWLTPRTARANGAFPGSFRVFAPAGESSGILLATNFGLVTAPEGGRWEWICEHGDALFATGYELGPGPSPRLYAMAPAGLAVSTDGACSWTAPIELQAATISGIFADPQDASKVWVVARTRDAGMRGSALYLSTDAGASFGKPRFSVPLGSSIDSVETARSRPERLYLTVTHWGPPTRVEIVRSDDGGMTFTTYDLTAQSRGDQLRITGVDPIDPERVYLRAPGFPDERLVVSADGGASVTDALIISRGLLTAFFIRADNSIVAGGLTAFNEGNVYVSTDSGRSFELRSTAIHPRAFTERDGVLFAATEHGLDGFALAKSVDGRVWEPLGRFGDVAAIKQCPGRTMTAEACAGVCAAEVVRGLFPEATCGPSSGRLPGPPRAQGSPAASATSGQGCACRAGDGVRAETGSGSGTALVMTMTVFWAVRRRAARTRRASATSPGGFLRAEIPRADAVVRLL